MLTIGTWRCFLKITQYLSGALGVLFNFVLILLIIFRSPNHLGAYKFLMIYISVFEITYSILDGLTEAHVFSYGPAFLLLRYFKHSIIGRKEGFYLLVTYCGTFGLSLALFGVHFIYRYGAVDTAFRKKYLSGKKLAAMFWIPLVYGVWWSGVVLFCYGPSQESDEFIRIPLLQGYETRVEDISYAIVWFYAPNKLTNQLEPVWLTFIGIACLWFMSSSSFFCVMYFGIKCYRKITKALKNSKMSSHYARSIQQQLFQALVMQVCHHCYLSSSGPSSNNVYCGELQEDNFLWMPKPESQPNEVSGWGNAEQRLINNNLYILEKYLLLCGCWKRKTLRKDK